MTRVSVCMATYNGAKYIKEQVDSILNQEFKENPDIELELIVSDDGSDDDTLNKLRGYNDSRIKIFYHKKIRNCNNALLACTQNFGHAMSKATGDYIFLSDQDDVWYPHKVDKSVSLLKKVGSGVVATSFEVGDGDLSNIYNTYKYKPESRFKLKRDYGLYGFSCAFTKDMLNYFLPMPDVLQHDTFIHFISAFLNRYYILDISYAIHRWSGEHNTSSAGNYQSLIIKIYYRAKLIYYVCWRILKNKLFH